MKRKILAILVSLLFIIMIPSTLGVTSESEDRDPCLGMEIICLKGLLFDPPKSERNTYFAIRLFYKESHTPTEEEGVIIFDWVTVKLFSPLMGRTYEGGLGLFIYVFGFFEGGLEVL